ncbi:Wd repeat-containing protein [Thalictrum thalictroides]|uniref:Wd repeat-containing protein n=1 Tax=Thalictrum thalictroides TaxID=46969 RepID=A0A7J6X252_THATH|nr:Wd repeat-containing protein [Thalictrum thalictroides]
MVCTEKNTVKRLKKDIKQLNLTLSQLQALLEEKEAQICHLRSKTPTMEAMMLQKSSSTDSLIETPRKEEERQAENYNISDSSKPSMSLTLPQSEHDSSSITKHSAEGSESRDTYQMFQENYYSAENVEVQREEEFPEVKIDFQETFLGHTSPITRCRFSASGSNIASASVDGTVRIWTYDSSTPTSRNAAIYCGAEIMSLDWECKSDRLLLIGTADGGIKAWNVDAKRVVCDLNTTQAFPSVLDLKCSPVEPIFVSAAASRGTGSSNLDNMKFASLTVWNMKAWKPMTVLPLGEDPPAITSLSFNHNGKILAAAATDGMIHIFDKDMSAGLQITGWPAHDSAISSVLFGHDETSIFGLGSDGKASTPLRVLRSANCHLYLNVLVHLWLFDKKYVEIILR